jgi:hypothetical protein
MPQRLHGWIMPEADILSLLRLIDERTSSPEIDVRHRDALIRLQEILESDLADSHRGGRPTVRQSNWESAV